MMPKTQLVTILCLCIFCVFLLIGSAYLIPWRNIRWGKLEVLPGSTIIVSGTAKTEQQSQIAQFSAGVNSVHDTKDIAVDEVNKKMDAILDAVKTFGIASSDIQTSNLSVYQNEETYYEDGRQKSRPGQWRVSNTITIKLRNVEKTSEFTDLLSQSGATNIYGPNFIVDDTDNTQTQLLGKAIENAVEKAKIIAQSTGRPLGKIINVSETGNSYPVYGDLMVGGKGGGGGAPIEPGGTTIQKTISVTFELN